ncbi:MAG TPA: hypothetical protein VF508_13350 [Pyrinomonadaceae bacterium]|jgi:hypothetical protein
MKNWCWASAWIFGILCAVNGGAGGFVGGMIAGFVIGALLGAAVELLSLAVRLAVWAGLLGVAVLLLAK